MSSRKTTTKSSTARKGVRYSIEAISEMTPELKTIGGAKISYAPPPAKRPRGRPRKGAGKTQAASKVTKPSPSPAKKPLVLPRTQDPRKKPKPVAKQTKLIQTLWMLLIIICS